MAKRVGGAGRGPMTDAAFRAKQAELSTKKQGQREYETQTQQTQQGIQGGLDRMQAQQNIEAQREQQQQQFQQQQQQFQQQQNLSAAKADLEYDPNTRTYKPTAMAMERQKAGIQAQEVESEAKMMKAKADVWAKEQDAIAKMRSIKLREQVEGRRGREVYIDAEMKGRDILQKYDGWLADLMSGGKKDGSVLAAILASGNPSMEGVADGVKAGDPQAMDRAMAFLRNRRNMAAISISAVTGKQPDLPPNDPAAIAWNEHYRMADAEIRRISSQYLMMGKEHPLLGLTTDEQKRLIIERAAESFLPLFAMRAGRMQNGAGTGTPTPGAGGVQGSPNSKFVPPEPTGPGGAGPAAPSAPSAPGDQYGPYRANLGDQSTGLTPGGWDQQR